MLRPGEEQRSMSTLKLRLLKKLKCTLKYEKLAWAEGAQLVALWLPLSLLQLGLYLLQENGEALAAGRPLPGIGAVAGVHSPVLAVHLLVAQYRVFLPSFLLWMLGVSIVCRKERATEEVPALSASKQELLAA